MARKVARTLKWFAGVAFALIALAVAFYVYLVMSFDTETLPEGYGQVGSVLYTGDQENQPLIVGFGGSEGGNAWAAPRWKSRRDNFLEQGYALLALAYFGTGDTPAELDRISVDGVHAAIVEAARDPRINGDCIAIVGGSKGAELALLLASHYPDIKAVVGIVPGHAVFPAHTIAMNTPSFALDGEPLPFVPTPLRALPSLLSQDLRAAYEAMLADGEAVERAAIPVERINGPILLLSASRDEFWPSMEMSDAMVERLDRHEFRFAVDHTAIEGTHEAPLNRFDLVDTFLEEHILQESKAGCPR